MRQTLMRGVSLSGFSALFLALSSCQSSEGADRFQFDPVPIAEFGAQDLEPARPRSVADMLSAANDALETANAAHEGGKQAQALRHYMLMLELLIESELDPRLFYNMRDDFQTLIDRGARYARATQDSQPRAGTEGAVEFASLTSLRYPQPLPQRVLNEIQEIQTLYPESFLSGLERSYRYLPFIRERFQRADLPEDLVWLAMVESQYTPRINSHAGAGGMWQFMRSTGRRYGLTTNYYVDERYDWKKSTDAAIAYLSELYELFDRSWPLAISAYNMGEAGLERAIASNGGERDIWRLLETPPAAHRIRRETKKFYPKLLASALVGRNPERFGMYPLPQKVDDSVYITVEDSYSLRAIERAAKLDRDVLVKLNPQLLHSITPPGKHTDIVVPAPKKTAVVNALRKLPTLRPDTHVVQPGETLGGIAQMYRVPYREIQRLNNIRSPRRLQIGQRLVVPGRVARPGSGHLSTSEDGRKVYNVRRGDSLSAIAAAYKTTVRSLQEWNTLGRSTRIHVGDNLYVSPAQGRSTAAKKVTPPNAPLWHVVTAGEFPAKIAKSYNLTLNDFLAWNGLNATSMIRVGDKLRVFPPSEQNVATSRKRDATPPADTVKTTHRVRRGENASLIAKRYRVRTRDLLAWNNLTTRSVLHIGDKLTLYLAKENAPETQPDPPAATSDTPEKIIHVVKRGQNPTTIARRYKVKLRDLFAWNDWKSNPVLHIGDEVTIYPSSKSAIAD